LGGAFAVVAYGQSHAASLFSASASQSRVGSSSTQSSSSVAAPSAATQASLNAAKQYADSHWNCVDAGCSSTVSAGTGQPNYQCAEFVARSLAAAGFVPGLGPNSPQSAYDPYVAPNGRSYDLLWVGWTTASGYSTGINGLYQYLTQNGIAADIGQVPTSEIALSDVVIYHEGQGHTAIVVQTGSSPLVDAHNNARYHVGYTEGYSDFTILHLTASGKLPTPPPTGNGAWPTVSVGSTGENVVSIQLLLAAHGYNLAADGSFGPQTQAAVKAFQSAHKLSVDGVVGPQTWSALIVTTQQGSTGPAVEAVQRQLNTNGQSVSVDSNFGPLTKQAVMNFQRDEKLQVDGIAGPLTWQSLVSHASPAPPPPTQTLSSASWPTVSVGSNGENIFSIQLLLQARGYSLGIDGSFGPQTQAAVKAFQSAHNLSVDGVVGPQTWSALIITTQQGSTGSAVEALQRQLNAHGASLTTDGNFGPLTNTAVRNYQSSHKLGVDGIAGPQTWQSLVTSKGSTPPPPPPPPPPGSILWGFDSAQGLSGSNLPAIISARGKPAFIGRYIDKICCISTLSASEAAYIHSQGIHIMVLDSSITTNDTTTATGVWMANRAITNAHALGIPNGVAIFADIESGSAVDAGFIEGWYNTITAAGYKAGYYNNPYAGSSGFDGAFCSAIGSNANIAKQTILWSDEPSLGWTTEANAPSFAPAHILCGGKATGNMLAWQYALSGGSFDIDSDEISSSVPLW